MIEWYWLIIAAIGGIAGGFALGIWVCVHLSRQARLPW
jgi:hypothetical protein